MGGVRGGIAVIVSLLLPDINFLLHASISDGVGCQHEMIVVEPDYWRGTRIIISDQIGFLGMFLACLVLTSSFLIASNVVVAKSSFTCVYAFQVSMLKTARSGME